VTPLAPERALTRQDEVKAAEFGALRVAVQPPACGEAGEEVRSAPRGCQPGSETQIPPAGARLTMQKTVLVVDDEPDVVAYLSALLHDSGYQTLEAHDAEQALNHVRTSHPDLITLDISMPEMSGVKAYRTLREDSGLSAIPVVIVTGLSHDFRQFISTRRHVPPPDGYLEKPIDAQNLLAEVKRLIG
jgi:CheY-like chemotaxis protein